MTITQLRKEIENLKIKEEVIVTEEEEKTQWVLIIFALIGLALVFLEQ